MLPLSCISAQRSLSVYLISFLFVFVLLSVCLFFFIRGLLINLLVSFFRVLNLNQQCGHKDGTLIHRIWEDVKAARRISPFCKEQEAKTNDLMTSSK